MKILNVEIKAKSENHEEIEEILLSEGALFKGIDLQVDTYFKVKEGRLKLREGNIENSLIFYKRKNQDGPKNSHVELVKLEKQSGIKDLLTKSNGVLTKVQKERKIFFAENVKIHLDKVEELGSFLEIEAIDESGKLEKEELENQCKNFMEKFGVKEKDLVSCSYSDLILSEKTKYGN